MLSFIQIHNFAIVDEVELELDSGLTVLTGETGAGKSIIVDALGLVLGDRADAGALRQGEDRAEITAAFHLEDSAPALAWLEEQALNDDNECVVRRVLNRNGRSRAFINGRAVPLATLKTLGNHLADIHGQHEHQSLVRPPVQRQILDYLGAHESLVSDVCEKFGAWSELRRQIAKLRDEHADRNARLDLLGYQVRELNALSLAEGEVGELEREHRKLAGAGRLAEGVQSALDALGGGDASTGAQSSLGLAQRSLTRLVETDPGLADSASLLESAGIQLTEAIDFLHRYLADLEMDPARLNWLEERMASIHDLARKHRVEAEALPGLAERLGEELAQLEGAEEELDSMLAELDQLEQAYVAAAARLSKARQRAADRMSKEVSALMQALGMAGGRFEARVGEADQGVYTEHGRDQIEFSVTANPGQDPAPLNRVASGGELSRISLAIQVIAADVAPTGCLVFDEVDAGVGGGVAEIVGRRLRELGGHRQVLCVTHLPQVASQAHRHVRVSKLSDGKTTRTSLKPLNKDETIEEIARMLGGVDITQRTRAHAREMLQTAKG